MWAATCWWGPRTVQKPHHKEFLFHDFENWFLWFGGANTLFFWKKLPFRNPNNGVLRTWLTLKSSYFLFFKIFFVWFKKKIKNEPVEDLYVSVGPANSTKTQVKSPLTEEKEELVFIKIGLNSRNNSYKYIHRSQPYSKVMKFSAKLFNYWLQDDQM